MRCVGFLLALIAGFSSADELRAIVPTALAARIRAGDRAGQLVTVEPDADGVLVTVSRTVRALSGLPTLAELRLAGGVEADSRVVPVGFVLPPDLASLTSESSSSLDAVIRIVEYVSRRITLNREDGGAQDAVSVLVRGRARCSGRANLAVGLMRAAGIPARVVQGISVGETEATWHRWGEAWLGSGGWIAFDPGASVGLVSVRYVPLSGAGEGASLDGVRVVHIDEAGYFGAPRRGSLRVLPAGGVTVHCRSAGHDPVVVVALLTPDGSWLFRKGNPEVVFSGLLSGSYRLVWQSRGIECWRSLRLGSADDVRIELGDITGVRS